MVHRNASRRTPAFAESFDLPIANELDLIVGHGRYTAEALGVARYPESVQKEKARISAPFFGGRDGDRAASLDYDDFR